MVPKDLHQSSNDLIPFEISDCHLCQHYVNGKYYLDDNCHRYVFMPRSIDPHLIPNSHKNTAETPSVTQFLVLRLFGDTIKQKFHQIHDDFYPHKQNNDDK